ncbi:MAG: aminotransferase class III-fold pyridoxal phosphate-dependent enzyme [Polyangiaceae bacterium]
MTTDKPIDDHAYHDYCKPKLTELLHCLGIDQGYTKAAGCCLWTDTGRTVIDFVGGFGAALVGHNHPVLKAAMVDALNANVAIQAQASVRTESGRLASRLSDLTPGDAEYYSCFTNSGAESIEAAVKHAYKVHLDRITLEYERVSRILNDFYYAADESAADVVIPGGKKLIDFRDDVDEYNLAQFEHFQDHPTVIAFKGAYHGKTTSALKVTFNRSYREGFQGLSSIDTVFIDPVDVARIPEIIRDKKCVFYYPVLKGSQVELRPTESTTVIAVMFEPILGEGGIIPLPDGTIQYLADHHRAHAIPYIVDEIQTGCGRTGSFYAYEQTQLARISPEYITLSKALGGGLVKIGAAMIRKDIYEHDFGILHTSTFGEDDLSARVASRFLDVLFAEDAMMLRSVREQGEKLKSRLQDLHRAFPTIIREVRGRGLMLAVEFTDLADRSPFFRLSGKQGVLSLLVASYLLHHHGVRLLAPLTTMLKGNPGKNRKSVVRIQPPAMISDEHIDTLFAGFREVLRIIDRNDEYCFIGHLLGCEVSAEERANPRAYPNAWPTREESRRLDSRTGFIIHPTSLDTLKSYFFPSFADHDVDGERLRTWWNEIARFLEPVHVKSDYVCSNDFVIESNLVLVPYLPEYLMAPKAAYRAKEVRDKIQDGVVVAKELGDDNIPLTMVGLGAFTSIVTNNGLTINDYEMAITSGNAFTVALTILGMKEAVRARGKIWSNVSVAVVGANGSIGQATARVLARQVGRLLLVGSSREDSAPRLQLTKRLCVEDALNAAPAGGEDFGPIRGALLRVAASAYFATPAEVARSTGPGLIDVATDFQALADVDVVVVATNSTDAALLHPRMMRGDAIVCCTSVPSNLHPDFSKQSAILAFAGGLARLPEESEVRFVGLPKHGMTFGCLAETLLLGFEGYNHSYAKGVLQPSFVEQTIAWAETYGFTLGPLTLNDKVILASPAA